jgi:hypothetical protein
VGVAKIYSVLHPVRRVWKKLVSIFQEKFLLPAFTFPVTGSTSNTEQVAKMFHWFCYVLDYFFRRGLFLQHKIAARFWDGSGKSPT